MKPMGFRLGIVGLPNVGKSTLFNALTRANVAAENYPFCTTDPHVGNVAVPDGRLLKLAELLEPERVVPAVIEFVDIAGLIKGASQGEGMGNEFLDHIRNVDAIAQVARCFEDPSVTFHESVSGVDPVRDAEIVEFELIRKDLQWVEKRKERIEKLLRTGDKSVKTEVELLARMAEWLNRIEPLSSMELPDEAKPVLRELCPLTLKPMFYLANLGEEATGGETSPHLSSLLEYAAKVSRQVAPFFARLEYEVTELPVEEQDEFRAELGLPGPGIGEVVRAGYEALGLVTFYTKVGPELRAWTVPEGTAAPKAAGKIHTDFEKGFVKAEVAGFEEFVEAGSEPEAKKRGLLRVEGKDYRVRDGDVVRFKFGA